MGSGMLPIDLSSTRCCAEKVTPPRVSPASWPTCNRSHHDVRVCDGQTGEKKKWSRLSIIKRDGTGDPRLERNSLLGVASPVIWGHDEVLARAEPSLRAMSGAKDMQPQGSGATVCSWLILPLGRVNLVLCLGSMV